MKKLLVITGIITIVAAITSCDRTRRNTGHAYMPDMTYSVAYETYAPAEERLSKYGAHYDNKPVEGTIARGDAFPYKYKNDSSGYSQSAGVVNPLTSLSTDEMQEAGRLYMVNCAICHGPKLDGQGPLFTSGAFQAAPKNFMDPVVKTMAEGTMFHSVTYGKGMMGSYASQLNTRQRWMIISFIKNKQKSSGTTAPASKDSASAKTAAVDTTKTTKK